MPKYVLFYLKLKFAEPGIVCKIYDYLSGSKNTWLKKYRKCIKTGHTRRPLYKMSPMLTSSGDWYRIRKLTYEEIKKNQCEKGVSTFILHGQNILLIKNNLYAGGVQGLSYKKNMISYKLWRLTDGHKWLF